MPAAGAVWGCHIVHRDTVLILSSSAPHFSSGRDCSIAVPFKSPHPVTIQVTAPFIEQGDCGGPRLDGLASC